MSNERSSPSFLCMQRFADIDTVKELKNSKKTLRLKTDYLVLKQAYLEKCKTTKYSSLQILKNIFKEIETKYFNDCLKYDIYVSIASPLCD